MKNLEFLAVITIVFVFLSCNIFDAKSDSSNKVDLYFIEYYFLNSPIEKDRIALGEEYKLDELWEINGYSKGRLSDSDFQFLYYDEENNDWVGFVTNNESIIEKILSDVSNDKGIQEIDGKYLASDFSISWSRAEAKSYEVVYFVMRRNKM